MTKVIVRCLLLDWNQWMKAQGWGRTFHSQVERSNHYITMPSTTKGPTYKVSYDLSTGAVPAMKPEATAIGDP